MPLFDIGSTGRSLDHDRTVLAPFEVAGFGIGSHWLKRDSVAAGKPLGGGGSIFACAFNWGAGGVATARLAITEDAQIVERTCLKTEWSPRICDTLFIQVFGVCFGAVENNLSVHYVLILWRSLAIKLP